MTQLAHMIPGATLNELSIIKEEKRIDESRKAFQDAIYELKNTVLHGMKLVYNKGRYLEKIIISHRTYYPFCKDGHIMLKCKGAKSSITLESFISKYKHS